MKKILSIFSAVMIAVSMLMTTSVSVSAEMLDTPVEEIIIEEYLYADSISNYLIISGNTATCESAIRTKLGTTRIVVKNYLEHYISGAWVTVTSWEASVTGSTQLFTNDTYTSLFSGTYRLKTVFEVYMGNHKETLTRYAYA